MKGGNGKLKKTNDKRHEDVLIKKTDIIFNAKSKYTKENPITEDEHKERLRLNIINFLNKLN
jgi:hypothetical protein